MPRRHSAVNRLVKKIQETFQPQEPSQSSSLPQTSNEALQEWPHMRFNIRAGFSLYSGLAFLLVSFILLLGVLIIQTASPLSETWSINPLTLILAAPLVGMFMSGLYFILNGLSASRSQVLLGKTKMAVDPLFWEKRVTIAYRQIANASLVSSGHGRQIRRESICLEYHPLNENNEIDTSQVQTLNIQGAENQKQLLSELQQRAAALGHIPTLPKSKSDKKSVLQGNYQRMEVDKSSGKRSRDYLGMSLSVFLVGCGILVLLMGERLVWLRAKLPENGTHTMGVVVAHRIQKHVYADHYYVTSEYDVLDIDGRKQPITQEHNVSREQYNSFPVGSTVSIIFLPDNPSVSDIWVMRQNL